MNSIRLVRSSAAIISIGVAAIDGISMSRLEFLVDTGATHTTIPKSTLQESLGYTNDYIQANKIFLPENERPIMANGERADVYKVPITRMTIGEYEIQHDFILSSDTVNLSFLLGLDILRYFKFTFDFDATDEDAPYGKMFYSLRETMRTSYKKLGESFAHRLSQS